MDTTVDGYTLWQGAVATTAGFLTGSSVPDYVPELVGAARSALLRRLAYEPGALLGSSTEGTACFLIQVMDTTSAAKGLELVATSARDPGRRASRLGRTGSPGAEGDIADHILAEEARLWAEVPAEYRARAQEFVGGVDGVHEFDSENVLDDEDLYD